MAQADYPPRDRLSLRAYIRARLRGRGLLEFADDDEEARRSADLVYVNCGRAWHEDAVARTPLDLEALMATTTDMPAQGIGNTVMDNDEFWSSSGSSTNTLGDALLYRFRQPFSRVAYVSVAVYRAFYQHGDPLYPPSKVSFLTGPTPNQLYPASPVYPVRLSDEQQFFALTPTAAVSRYLMVRFHGRRQRQWEDLQYYIAIRHVAAYGDPGDPSYDLQIARLARCGGVAWPCSRGMLSAARWEAGDGAPPGRDVDFWTPFRQLQRSGRGASSDLRGVREDVYLAGPVSSAESRGWYVSVALPRGALAAPLSPGRGLGPQPEDIPTGHRGAARKGLPCAVMPSGPPEAELRLATQAAGLSRALPHLVQVAWPGVLLTRGAARRLQQRMERKLRGRGQGLGLQLTPPGRSVAGGIGAMSPFARGDAALEPPSSAEASHGRRLLAGLYDESGVSMAYRGWMGEDDEYDLYGEEYDEDGEGDSSDGERGRAGYGVGPAVASAAAAAASAAAGVVSWGFGSLRRLQDWVVAAAAGDGDVAAGPARMKSGGDDVYDNMDADTRGGGAAATGSTSSSGDGSDMSGSSDAGLGRRSASGPATSDCMPAAGQSVPEHEAAVADEDAVEDEAALLSPALALLHDYLLLRNDLLDRARAPAAPAAAAGAAAAAAASAPSTSSAAAGRGQQPGAHAGRVVPHLHRSGEQRTVSTKRDDRDEWLQQAAWCSVATAAAAASRARFEPRENSVAWPGAAHALRHTPPPQRLPPPKLRRRGSTEVQAPSGDGRSGDGDATATAGLSCWRHQRAARRAMRPAVYRPERSSPLFVALEAWAGVGAGAGSAASVAVKSSCSRDAGAAEGSSGCWLVSDYDHEHM